MKIIDLLNRIANGEEVPKKFMVDGDTLYIGEDKFIEHANGERIEWFIYPSWLNEEVEILEEKKIPEKLYIRERANDILIGKSEKICYATSSLVNKEIANKINEIIDYLDYLKSKGE